MVFLLNSFSVQNSCDNRADANAVAIDQILVSNEDSDMTSNQLAILNAVASLQAFFDRVYPSYELCLVGDKESVRKDLQTPSCCKDCEKPDFGSKPHPFIHLGDDELQAYPLVQQLQIVELNRLALDPKNIWNYINPSLGNHTMGLVDTSVAPSLEECGYGISTNFGIVAYTGPQPSTCSDIRTQVKLILANTGTLPEETIEQCTNTIHNKSTSLKECMKCWNAVLQEQDPNNRT